MMLGLGWQVMTFVVILGASAYRMRVGNGAAQSLVRRLGARKTDDHPAVG